MSICGMPLLYQASENIVGNTFILPSGAEMNLYYEAITWGGAAVETFIRTGYSNTASDDVIGIDANTALGIDSNTMIGIRAALVDAGWIPRPLTFTQNGTTTFKGTRGIEIRVIVVDASELTDSITVSIG